MCIAIPGKIVEKKGENVVVDYGDNKVSAGILTGDYEVGDFVVVQGKVVVEKIPTEQVKKWNDFLNASK